MELLAFSHVGSAALDHQFTEETVIEQGQAGILRVGKKLAVLHAADRAPECAFEGLEVAGEIVDAKVGKGGGMPLGEQFDEVLEIRQVIVDRRGGEEEHGLVGADQIEQALIA